MFSENLNARFKSKLSVITHVSHWIGADGIPWAYEPYVREMNIWCDLFSQVEICAPIGEGSMPSQRIPYDRANISWVPAHYSNTNLPLSPVKRLAQMPGLVFNILRTILHSDFVLLRSPGHSGLVGNFLVRIMRKASITKWAGEFGTFEGERWPSRFERWLLCLPTSRHFVLMYGPSDAPHFISFLPALMSRAEMQYANTLAAGKNWHSPLSIISVGKLLPVKNFDLILTSLGKLQQACPDLEWTYTLIGDGPEYKRLKELASQNGIANRVTLTGGLPFLEVQKHYSKANILVMACTKEGWPKVIPEAWAHSVYPVAASAGLVPWIFQGKDAGVLFDPFNGELENVLEKLLRNPERIKEKTLNLPILVDELSLESFAYKLEQVLIEKCGLR